MTSEFREKRWAVMSERGREAEGVAYTEAVGLVRELKGAGLSGLCVITDEAASHLPPAKKGEGKAAGNTNGKRQRRASKKKGAV